MVFPTPVQIYKYENNIEKELKHIESLEWKAQPVNGNFRSADSYLTKHEQLQKIVLFFKECIDDYCKTIINSDQIILFNKGKILVSGNHKELIKNSDYYKKLYNTGT